MAVLRDPRMDEAETIRELVVEAYRDYAEAFGEARWIAMEAGLRDLEHWSRDGMLIVAVEGESVLGSIAYYPPGKSDPALYEPEWASLRMLAVRSEARGRGLGRLLTEECLRRARRDGAGVIALHTSELMVHARSMYERLGFRIHHEMDRPGPRYWVYTLELSAQRP